MKKYISVMFLFALVALALAGAPPPDAIPWQSCIITDTIGDVVLVDTVFFIMRDKYMSDVLGMEVRVSLGRTERKLEAIQAYLKARKK